MAFEIARYRLENQKMANFGRQRNKERHNRRRTISDKRWRWKLKFIDLKVHHERIQKSSGRPVWNTRWEKLA